ncbi:MAG: hypothetical protein ACLRZH_06475 [Ruthenibacterium lactatiformans]
MAGDAPEEIASEEEAQRTHISRKMGRRSANESRVQKDLKSAFTGMIGWVLCAFVVVVVGLYFTAICCSPATRFQPGAYNTTFIFLVVVPAYHAEHR